MISKKAVEEFLNREVASLAWLKRQPREELLRALKDVGAPPWKDYSSLWNNQLAMLLAGIHIPQMLFFADMGLGKTRVILELIDYHKSLGKNCWLVCVPNVANIENWLVEIRKYAPDLEYVTLDVDTKTKRQLLRQKADVFITHYPGLVASCTDLAGNGGSRKRQINPPFLGELQRKFTGIVLDESTAIGNHSSLTARICLKIGQFCKYRYALTGTPFGRDPMPLWHQFKVIDDGEALGETLGLFREAFFTLHINYWGGYEYTFQRRRKRDLHRLIGSRSLTYTEGECQDLPERVHIKKAVWLPEHMESYYKNELAHIRKSHGQFREIEASFLRMRQLGSGFLGLKNDETCEKVEIEFPENPKIEALMEIIEEMPTDAKMLIFHEYIWTGNRISKELKSKKLKHERLHGEQTDQRGALRRFTDDPYCRFMVINSNSGAMGLNLQNAHYVVFVESPVRPIIRQQAERRARRSGQKSNRVFIIDLIAKSKQNRHSVDERILNWLADGKNLLQAVLKGGKI